MNNEIIFIVGIGLVIALLLVGVVVIKGKRKGNENYALGDFDIDTFLKCLGNIENIASCQATNSKISIELKDEAKLDVEKIKELGASGIVVTGSKVIVILGLVSKVVAEYIENKLSR